MLSPLLLQIISVSKDVATCFAAITGGIVAIIGLRAWKKQIKGKSEYDTARALLISVYKVRDAIGYVRWPSMGAAEIQAAMAASGVKDVDYKHPEFDYLSTGSVFQQRMKRLDETQSELAASRIEAEALLGKEVLTPLEDLYKIIAEYRASLGTYLALQSARNNSMDATYLQLNHIVFDHSLGKGDDAFSKKILTMVQSMEASVRPWLTLK